MRWDPFGVAMGAAGFLAGLMLAGELDPQAWPWLALGLALGLAFAGLARWRSGEPSRSLAAAAGWALVGYLALLAVSLVLAGAPLQRAGA